MIDPAGEIAAAELLLDMMLVILAGLVGGGFIALAWTLVRSMASVRRHG
jgi:hypothetical protein